MAFETDRLHGAHALPDNAAEIAARRKKLFRETPFEAARRIALGVAWPLMPPRVAGVPPLLKMWLKSLGAQRDLLPDPTAALDVPSGLAGIARDLSPPTLAAAYWRGLYPGGHTAPTKWISPAERCVLFFPEFHISKRSRSRLRQARYRVTFDRDFEGVIKSCAEPRPSYWPVTWIRPQIMRAFAELFDAGYAHSFEVWNADGELAGGGYGVAIGPVFVIESQFSREDNTSKIGFSLLVWHLARWGFELADNKDPTKNVLDMGFRVIPRSEYLARLDAAPRESLRRGRWQVETDLKTLGDWTPAAPRG